MLLGCGGNQQVGDLACRWWQSRNRQGSLTGAARQGTLSSVRIGEPALRHSIAESDALHAVRNAIRLVVMDENLTMLIGPAADGRFLEVGVLDLDGDDPVIIHAMPLRPKFRRFLR